MPMTYSHRGIAPESVPAAAIPHLQHVLETYASETYKVGAVWSCFTNADLSYTPHPKASTVERILTHQLLSERRFFGEFLGMPEPPAIRCCPIQSASRRASLGSSNSPWRDSRFSPSRTSAGGRPRFRSSMSGGNGSGCSGGVCSTRRITARN